jgi:photosystem II stability/assembly factor-like uncharacterized protein
MAGGTFYKYKDGRVWMQRRKFEPYTLLLPYGMTGVTDPVGNLNAIREPSSEKRGASVIADIIRGEPGLPQFQLETRLQKTLNYLFGLKECAVQMQCHLGHCDRPDNYYAAAMVMHWERSYRGDLSLDRLSIIEGDNAADQVQVPFVSEVGPLLLDMGVEFLSARTILETETVTGMYFLGSECLEDCRSQEDAGENGYLSTTALAGSVTNVANVWYTNDGGETWILTSTNPFAAAMDISDVVAIGTKASHRVIVANGTTRVADPAQIAYADVTASGTTTWVTVNVGSTNGQFITKLFFLDWMHVYALTNDGDIFMSVDGGASWTAVYTAGTVDLLDIGGTRNGVLWAVGESDQILKSLDFGASWDLITAPAASNYTSVCVTPDGTVIVGNDDGGLYGTYDDGATWITLSLQGIVATNVDKIRSYGDSVIWAAATTASGGKVLRSIDGGATFRLWSLNTPTNAGLNALFVVDPNIVFIGGDPQGGTAFISKTATSIIGF